MLAYSHSNRLQALDQLRAIAVICVLISHLGVAVNNHLIDLQNKSVNIGTIGVFIFFCVSGYVIPWSMQQKNGQGIISAKEFWVRRIFRLLPIYCIVGLLGFMFLNDQIILDKIYQDYNSSRAFYLLSYLTMTTYWRDQTTVFQGLEWTLAYEVVFYLACTAFIFCKRLFNGFLPLAILITTVSALTLLPDLMHTNNSVQKFFFMYLFFLVGLLTFLHKNSKILRTHFIKLSILLVLVITVRSALWYYYWGVNYMTFAFIPALIIFYLMAFEHIKIHSKALTLIGVISYSIYLTHIFVPHIIPLVGYPIIFRLIIWSLLAIGIAVPLYRFIELPSINLSRSFFRRSNIIHTR